VCISRKNSHRSPACSKAAQKEYSKHRKIKTAIIRSRTTLGAVFSAAAFRFRSNLDSAEGFKPISQKYLSEIELQHSKNIKSCWSKSQLQDFSPM
jgi:hypothetical protein